MVIKIRSALVLGLALLYASTAFAQDDHKLEVTVDYSYVHANPQNNDVIPTFSLNGGGGGFAYYFTRNVGIQAEFQGYGSYTHNFTLPPPLCNGPCTVSAQGNLFTYNIGPIVKFRTKHFEPFVETLFGGAHSNFYVNLKHAAVAPARLASLQATTRLISSSVVASIFRLATISPSGQHSLTIC
jgi:hypothetical protein